MIEMLYNMRKFLIFIAVLLFFAFYSLVFTAIIGGDEELIFIGSVAAVCLADFINRTF